jgi:hypothetical protein
MENAKLTEANFAKHLHTNFYVPVNGQRFELELAEVKSYLSGPEEQKGLERFSIFFHGSSTVILPQQIYSMDHEQMGTFQIFLVPVAKLEKGIRYEAVFNYYK